MHTLTVFALLSIGTMFGLFLGALLQAGRDADEAEERRVQALLARVEGR
jgi:hypothetical protein